MPAAVLFVCNLNRVRSPMAEALARRAGLNAESCGLVEAEEVDGFACAAMAELGVDLVDHEPRTFATMKDQPFDVIVALTPEARRHVEDWARGRQVETEFWPVEDPTLVGGAREQRLDAYRAVRETLRRRIKERFGRS